MPSGDMLSGIGGLTNLVGTIITANKAQKTARENMQMIRDLNQQKLDYAKSQSRANFDYVPLDAEIATRYTQPYTALNLIGGSTPGRAAIQTYQAIPGQYLPGFESNLKDVLSGIWGKNQVASLAPMAAARMGVATAAREAGSGALAQARNTIMATGRMASGRVGTSMLNRTLGATIPLAQQYGTMTAQAGYENAADAERQRYAAEQFRQQMFQNLPQSLQSLFQIYQAPSHAIAGDVASRLGILAGANKMSQNPFPELTAPQMPIMPSGVGVGLVGAGSLFGNVAASQNNQAKEAEMMKMLQTIYGGGRGGGGGGSTYGSVPGQTYWTDPGTNWEG